MTGQLSFMASRPDSSSSLSKPTRYSAGEITVTPRRAHYCFADNYSTLAHNHSIADFQTQLIESDFASNEWLKSSELRAESSNDTPNR
jgi:hypothetical protein